MLTASRSLIHPVDLPVQGIPPSLVGLRIAQISDLHVTRPGRRRYRQVLEALEGLKTDLAFLTGDYMCNPGDEPAAMAVMRAVVERLNPRLGVFGVFGNHDSAALRESIDCLPVRWLRNEVVRIDDQPIEILGLEAGRHERPDTLALVRGLRHASGNGKHGNDREKKNCNGRASGNLRLMLSHYPTYLPVASDLGVHVMFAGHTHGGQCRLPGRKTYYTSCDLPGRLVSGILRHRETLAAVSRGLGETFVPIRLFCAPQLPVYTMREGPLPGDGGDHVQNVVPW